jgi:hypothetical protein
MASYGMIYLPGFFKNGKSFQEILRQEFDWL